jgi:type IV pilus assembly protein PilV
MLSRRKTMHRSAPKSTQEGVLLIEAMIAILIFSIGILAIVGLQATMVKNTADSKFRSDASYIAQARIGAMWTDPANLTSYVETNTDISTQLPGGKRTVAALATAGQYQVTVTWIQPGPNATTHTFTTIARISGG